MSLGGPAGWTGGPVAPTGREELSSGGHPDGPRRGRTPVALGAVALAVVAGVLVLRQSDAPAPEPGPTPAPTHATTPRLSMTATRSYVHADPGTGRALVVVTLRNDDTQALTLSSVRVGEASEPVTASLVSFDTAQQLVTSAGVPGPAGLFVAMPVGGIVVPIGVEAAVVLLVTPDCAAPPPAPNADVIVAGWPQFAPAPGDLRVPARAAEASEGYSGWLQEATSKACGLVGDAAPDLTTTRTLRGLVLTTVGPSRPPAGDVVDVVVTVANGGTTPYRGSIGVMLVDRVRVTFDGSVASPTFLDADPMSERRALVFTGFDDPPVHGVAVVGCGLALTGQVVTPGATLSLTFHLRVPRVSGLLGPARGWVPTLTPDGSTGEAHPDPSTYPVVVLPRP